MLFLWVLDWNPWDKRPLKKKMRVPGKSCNQWNQMRTKNLYSILGEESSYVLVRVHVSRGDAEAYFQQKCTQTGKEYMEIYLGC